MRDEHYDKVGEGLPWTLEKDLGDAFTRAVKKAWAELYGYVPSTMKAAAKPIAASA